MDAQLVSENLQIEHLQIEHLQIIRQNVRYMRRFRLISFIVVFGVIICTIALKLVMLITLNSRNIAG